MDNFLLYIFFLNYFANIYFRILPEVSLGRWDVTFDDGACCWINGVHFRFISKPKDAPFCKFSKTVEIYWIRFKLWRNQTNELATSPASLPNEEAAEHTSLSVFVIPSVIYIKKTHNPREDLGSLWLSLMYRWKNLKFAWQTGRAN